MIVTFKTDGFIFEKEKSGKKPNTVREIDNKDERFKFLADGLVKQIQIINKDNPEESFVREIEDLTYFKRIVIISWRHKNE